MKVRSFLVIPKRSLIDYSIFFMIFITLAWYNYTPLVIGAQFLTLGLFILTNKFSLKKHTDYLLWWIVFIFYSVFTALYTPNKDSIFSMLISILQVAAIGIVIVNYIENHYSLDWTIKTICISGIVLCVRLLIEVPHGAWGTERIGNYIGYGNDSAAIVLCFAALFLYAGYQLFNKKAYVIIAVLFCAISVFTGSRKGIFIVVIGLVVMTVLSRNTISKGLFTFVILIGVIALGYIAIMNVPILYDVLGSRIEALIYTLTQGHRNATYNNSSEERILHMKYAFGFFKSHPIFGLGLDGYRVVCPIRKTYSHCNFTELLADMGIIGFILYYNFPVRKLAQAFSTLKNSKFAALPIGILFAFFVCDIGMVTYNGETIHIYFAICVAMIAQLYSDLYNQNDDLKG